MAIAAYGAARIVSSADASASAVRPLTDQILPTSALSGFVVPRSLSVTHSALSWVRTAEPATDLAFEAARLRRLGFVDGVDEQLHGRIPLAAEAMSIAEHYRSGAGARAQLAHTRQTALDLSGAPAQTYHPDPRHRHPRRRRPGHP